MVLTLADAQANTQDDVSFAIIDELRRYSWLMDQVTFDDCVNPAGGGATLTYGYTRLTQVRGAAWRPYNTEYTPAEAKRQRFSVDLSPLGGRYRIDRVLAHLGPRATDEMAFQIAELLTGVRQTFQTEIIRGDVAANPAQSAGNGDGTGFDGLDKALTGSATEVGVDEVSDWSAVDSESKAFTAIEGLEAMLALLNTQPTAIMTNVHGWLRLQAIGRRAGYITESEDTMGRRITSFAGVPIVDLGDINDGSSPVIPLRAATVDGVAQTGLTDIYACRFALDGFHGVSTVGELVRQWEPDWTVAGAVKDGEVEMGPLAMVLKHTKSAAVLRNVKVR
ncbi:MAG TPA: phage capsid protein [Naasia sp.]|jgi:hypothetical protein